VPSGASRGDCNRSVEMSRGADVHDVRRGEKSLESRRSRRAEGFGKRGRSGRVDVEDDDVDPFRSPCRQVRPADESGADKADSQPAADRSVGCSGTLDGHSAGRYQCPDTATPATVCPSVPAAAAIVATIMSRDVTARMYSGCRSEPPMNVR